MKWVWATLALVVIGGMLAVLWPDARAHAPQTEAKEVSEATPVTRAEPAPTRVEAEPPSRPALPATAASTPAPAPAATFQPERMPDGTLRLDGRFLVPGSGSEQDPFVLTWPLLASASSTLDGASGRLVPPPHIAFLSGQWVQISAFLAPPLWGEKTSELLVMKNRWDGCCIGLPPTPFDCIEASLAAPITLGAKHSISFGTVRGRLVVEPFTAGSFLIGLYRLESAQIDEMKAR
ncbi:MAG: hypothetical protein ACKPEA_15030 [Planctomycetota bacterium]